MTVDVEALSCDYLRSVPAVATLVGAAVWTDLPASLPAAYVKVERIGGSPDQYPYQADRARLQLSATAPTKSEAHDLARAVQAAMWALAGQTTPFGTVTAVEPDGGFLSLPDDTYPTPKPRYLFGALVTAHP